MYKTIKTQVAVLGSGPGGYSAAFRCADLGFNTTIIERYSTLGGVCLNVGCIPSKTLLHISKLIETEKKFKKYGIFTENTKIDIKTIRTLKENIVQKLTIKLEKIANLRKIKIINGYGKFLDDHTFQINNNNHKDTIKINFDFAIIAAGSRSNNLLCNSHNDHRIWNSTDALTLKSIPKKLLIVGAGAIGLEMATIYHSLGSNIDIIEEYNQIIPSLDKDITDIFTKIIKKKINVITETKIIKFEPKKDGIYVNMQNKKNEKITKCYDSILISIGRIPNGKLIDAEKAGIYVNNFGFIPVDKQMRTNIKHIFAIGDIVNHPMLAHKSIYEGHIAAEIIYGKKRYFDPKVIPSIIYTNPEIAWTGYTEKLAQEKKINYKCAVFPWSASGKAITSDCSDYGLTKLIFNTDTNRIIGGIILGNNAGELLGEISLAIEMGCEAEDITLTMHAHPTLYESIGLAAAVYNKSITDLFIFKKP